MLQLIKYCLFNGNEYGFKFINKHLQTFNWHRTDLIRPKFAAFQLTTRKCSKSTTYTDRESKLLQLSVKQDLVKPLPGLVH